MGRAERQGGLVGWAPGVFEGHGADGLRVPARLVAHARLALAPSLSVVDAGPDVAPDRQAYTAVIHDGGAFHYFHMMESLVWLWALQHGFMDGRPPDRIVLCSDWDEKRLGGVGRPLMEALYPRVPLDEPGGAWPRDFGPTLILSRDWADKTHLNKYLQAGMRLAAPHVPLMGEAARRAVGGYQSTHPTGRILYVPRQPPRCLSAPLEEAILARLRMAAPVSVVDFACLPWAQQVRQAAAHDVMLGVHGNGLTNALWMRPGSRVVELFSPGAHHYDYQFFAELAGLDYIGFERERVFKGGERYGDAYGHNAANNVTIDTVDLEAIVAAVTG